jgi:hypothetical protein
VASSAFVISSSKHKLYVLHKIYILTPNKALRKAKSVTTAACPKLD